MRKHVLLVSLALTLTLAACGGGGGTENKPTEAPKGGEAAPALTGTVSGKISFDGTAPKMAKIQMSADPVCAMANKEPFMEETVQVSDGGLENVIVYVSKGLEGKTFPVPSDPVLIDQNGCHYVPHAFTIMVGQTLNIKNSDMTTHNIHMYNGENTLFNTSEPVKDQVVMKTFDKEMAPVSIRCDVHKWMNATMGVFSHPSHTVSKKGGAFEFKVPPGTYEVTAFHEKLGEQKMMVTVPDNGKAELNFTFKS
jgi:plastocyanin